jgi:hypothetical protein
MTDKFIELNLNNEVLEFIDNLTSKFQKHNSKLKMIGRNGYDVMTVCYEDKLIFDVRITTSLWDYTDDYFKNTIDIIQGVNNFEIPQKFRDRLVKISSIGMLYNQLSLLYENTTRCKIDNIDFEKLYPNNKMMYLSPYEYYIGVFEHSDISRANSFQYVELVRMLTARELVKPRVDYDKIKDLGKDLYGKIVDMININELIKKKYGKNKDKKNLDTFYDIESQYLSKVLELKLLLDIINNKELLKNLVKGTECIYERTMAKYIRSCQIKVKSQNKVTNDLVLMDFTSRFVGNPVFKNIGTVGVDKVFKLVKDNIPMYECDNILATSPKINNLYIEELNKII